MLLFQLVVLFSGISFLIYGISWFTSPFMKNEFKRFQLERFGLLTVILEIAGAVGLFIGLKFHSILLISSAGLALLMFFGLLVRLKVKDGFWVSLPALLFMLLNIYIFIESVDLNNLK